MTREQSSNRCNWSGRRLIGRIVRGIAITLVFVLVFGIFVRLLWNWLMPGIFGFHEISFEQAFGIIVLARLLFGVRGIHGMRPEFAGRWRGNRGWGWGPCSHADTANGEIKDWRYYEAWWQAEGREAFKKYIDSHAKSGEK